MLYLDHGLKGDFRFVMSTPDKEMTSQAWPPGDLADELSSIVSQVERVIQASQSGLPEESTHEWDLLAKRLRTVMAQLPTGLSAKTHVTRSSHCRASDSASGIAFAAGSIPLGTRQLMTVATLGWVFGAGLLLGILIKRK